MPTRAEFREQILSRTKAHSLTSIELFTGAGGLAIATHMAGFDHQALFEWNPNACETLGVNAQRDAVPGIRAWNICEGDVRKADFTRFSGVDLVAGGPPCQPFSIGGRHRGEEDHRDMIPEFIRAVREARPRAFVMENVRGLTRPSFAEYLEYTLLQLEMPSIERDAIADWRTHRLSLKMLRTRGVEYLVHHRVLNAADFGVPQVRYRIFVVGLRLDCAEGWSFPSPTHSRERLLHEQRPLGEYWERHGIRSPRSPSRQGTANPQLFALQREKPWLTLRDAIHGLPQPVPLGKEPIVPNHTLQPGAKAYVGHTGSPLDLPCKALKAGVHGVPGGENMMKLPRGRVRYLSVREAARVQTFPDAWEFRGAWSEAMRQLGNAVPVELARAIASRVAEHLRRAADDGRTLQSARLRESDAPSRTGTG